MSVAFPGFERSKLVSFDLETTGPDPSTARVVTSALLRINGREVASKTWLADPGVAIPAEATAIHGITTEMAQRDGADHGTVIAETVAGIQRSWSQGYTLVVFNAPFDLTILRRFAPDFTIAGPVLDPFVVDRAVDPYRKGKRTLTALCEHYGVRLDGAHDAAEDALAAARLAWKLAEHEKLRCDGWEVFNALQAQWHEARQKDFAEYLARIGKSAADVNTKWPMAV